MKPAKRNRVVFGVDDRFPSRVAASILRNQGFDILAVHLQIDLAAHGLEPDTYPSALKKSDLPAIEKFCESLGVPLKVIDVTEETLAKVYNPFWVSTLVGKRYAADAAFAKEILFPHLEGVAKARGADLLATGHFARKTPELFRYPELDFDQSRILARLEPATLAKLILPVGEVSLDMLLRLAQEIGAVPKKEEEEDAVPKPNQQLAEDRALRGRWEWTHALLSDPRVQARTDGEYFSRGPVGGSEEFTVAEHSGLPFYQIGSKFGPDQYVHDIQAQGRQLIVGPESRLSVSSAIVQDLTWSDLELKNRHRGRRLQVDRESGGAFRSSLGPVSTPGILLEYPGRIAEIEFEMPLVGIAPGETLVFFEESRVLGSAVVVETRRADLAEKTIEKQGPGA